MDSSWFKGEAEIPTYYLEELMGTKLRALFQRHKGRDLFDIWYAFNHANLNSENIVTIFYHYLEQQNLDVTRAQFQKNFSEKAHTDLYLSDIQPLLAPDIKRLWSAPEAITLMDKEILPLLRGQPWKGSLNDA